MVTAVTGALTLVPALVGLAVRRLDRALRVGRRPGRCLAAGLVVLAVLTVPLFPMRLGHVDDGADPVPYTDRRAYDLIGDAFGPGSARR